MKHEKKDRKKCGTEAGILLAVTVCICIACGVEETSRAAMNAVVTDISVFGTILQETPMYDIAETAVPEEEKEPEGSFTVTYQGQKANNDIELRHCECVYDAEDIQIYAKYLYWLSVPETFPYDQYVLYIRTPQEELQLYPVRDFLVDEEHGILYTKIAGDDGFEKVKSISFMEKDSPMLNFEQEIFDAKQAEEMLCCAYGEKMGSGQEIGQSLFSNITVELTEVCTNGAGVLKGEIGGIEKVTGQRYYADWEINMADGTSSVALCVLKQYDPVKDKETFADCNRIFDQIEQGDWSHVKPIKEQYLWGMDAEEWIRMDVNGDGMPELVGGWTIEELPDYEDSRKIEISVIFACQDDMAEMVYVDVNDGMEFIFITAGGELVYEWGVSGGPATGVFRRCIFDLKWNREYLDTLVVYRFPEGLEEEELFEGEQEYYREYYPDTYGVGGSGTYYLRERRKTKEELNHNEDGKYTVREYLTEKEFLKMFEDWTGWDFYKAQWLL
ncbi:MAG: hypothetical protein HDR27_08395 [Lachnospiraceae bacterium]|nr:hypothetical protein [Lachnospiraceae bacterium]